jgi:hypothetical protein
LNISGNPSLKINSVIETGQGYIFKSKIKFVEPPESAKEVLKASIISSITKLSGGNRDGKICEFHCLRMHNRYKCGQ